MNKYKVTYYVKVRLKYVTQVESSNESAAVNKADRLLRHELLPFGECEITDEECYLEKIK